VISIQVVDNEIELKCDLIESISDILEELKSSKCSLMKRYRSSMNRRQRKII
jgi:hypothetical protein